MTIARGVAVAALALAIVLVAVLLLRGGGTHQYDLVFQNAGQLVKDDDVQVGGRRIGSIRKITLTDDNQARVKVEIQEPYAPLREGTQATIRLTSLSGIANRYIALTPAPNSAKEIDDDATLPVGSTTDVVDLDQIFNTLDPDTRKDLQGVIQGFAAQYQGKGAQAAKSAEYFNPFLSTSRRLVNQLTEDEGTLTDFIVNSSRAVTAVAERRDDLADLVGNTNATARAIGSENVALAQALGLLPTTLRRANTTFVNLRATLDDLDVLVAESKPATKDLAPFLRELRPLVHASRPTIRDLRKLVTTPRRRQRPARRDAQAAQAPAGRQPDLRALDPGAPEEPAGARVHPPLHRGAHGLVPRLRPGDRQLRRQRPLRPHPADLQRLLLHRQPRRRRAAPAGPQRQVRGPADQHRQALPGRRQPAGRGRLGALDRRRQARRRRLRPEPSAPWPVT